MTAPAKDTATHGWVGSEPKEVTTKKTPELMWMNGKLIPWA